MYWAFLLRDSQSAGQQSFDKLTDADRLGSRCDEFVVPLPGNVVMIEVETTAGYLHPLGKFVQLSQGLVTDQV